MRHIFLPKLGLFMNTPLPLLPNPSAILLVIRLMWNNFFQVRSSEEIIPGQCFFQIILAIMGCFPLCQTDQSEISENTRSRKLKQHSSIKPGQPIGMALAIFYSFSEFPIRAKNRFDKNGTANSGQNIPTKISGPPPEVIPNIPVGRN